MIDLISRQAVLKLLSTMPPEDATTKALLIQGVKQMDAPDNLVKDSQGLVKDLVNDCISRQAAIDALGERPMVWAGSDYELGARNQYDADVLAIETVPSAQPKTHDKRTEMHACDLIDRQALMKEFSDFVRASNNSDFARTPTWNDAVSLVGSMPSAQPYTDEEIQKMQDIEQAQFDKIRELAYQAGKADAMRWIPCSERLPDRFGKMLVTFIPGTLWTYVIIANYSDLMGIAKPCFWIGNVGKNDFANITSQVVAWMPLPEPYKEVE